MSRGICDKCKSNCNYNFEINNGLCNICIADDLEKLEQLQKAISVVLKGGLKMTPMSKVEDTPLLDLTKPSDAYAYGWASCELEYGELLSELKGGEK